MNVKIINPIEYQSWDDLLTTNDQSSFFHTSVWARVLCESYNFKPIYFMTSTEGSLSSLIPVMEINSFLTGKKGISLPFTDFCQPIANCKGDIHISEKRLIQYGKEAGWRHFELRGGTNYFAEFPASAIFKSHSIDLSKGEKSIFKNFRESNQRNIRRAIKEDVQIRFLNTWEALKAFYQLHCITRRKHGLPPQPLHFFKKIFDHIIFQKKGYVALASHRNKLIAGAVFFHFGKKAIFKYGASIRKYHHLRPNNLLMWEAIRKYVMEGYRYFSLGKTLPQNSGLLQYKRGWRGRERTIYYYFYDLRKEKFDTPRDRFKSSYSFFKILPIPFLKYLGNILYGHAG